MATKKPAPSASRAVANWDEELAKRAAAAAETEASTSTSSFFGTKSGILTWNDSPLKNNEIACIIADSVLENIYFDKEFDSENPAPPVCFAFGREEKSMAPHELVIEKNQNPNDICHGCEKNKFGTASRGRGKACRNIRRLALVPAGSFDKAGEFEAEEDEGAIKSAQLGFLKIPVTSVRGYAAYVKQIAATLKRPPLGVFTKIKLNPDADNQFNVSFECLGLVPNELMAAVLAREEEARANIESPYNLDVEERPVAPPKSRKPAAKAVTKRKY